MTLYLDQLLAANTGPSVESLEIPHHAQIQLKLKMSLATSPCEDPVSGRGPWTQKGATSEF